MFSGTMDRIWTKPTVEVGDPSGNPPKKPVANRQVVDSQSACSTRCKKSVHVNSIVTWILNTSTRIHWSEYASPTDYITRMKIVGYD